MNELKQLINKLSEDKPQRILFVMAILFVFITVYILNRLYPLLAEDWDYSFIWNPTNDYPDRISGIGDIIKSQYTHYMFWGGRSITHGIDQFLLMVGVTWHDLLNSLAYVLFVYVVYRIINIQNKTNSVIFVLVALSLWFWLIDFMSTAVWITYSANYLWGTLIIIAFIYPYYTYYRKQDVADSGGLFKAICMFLAGIIAGWTNENISIAMVFFVLSMILWLKYQKIPIPRWALWGLAGAVIGCIILLIAPGNYLRLESSGSNSHDLFAMLIKRLLRMRSLYWNYMFLLSIIYTGLFIFFLKKSTVKDKSRIIFSSLLFFIAAHVGLVVMIGSPEFPRRVLFGLITFILIAIGILYTKICTEYTKLKIFNVCLIAVMFVFFCIDYADKYRYTSYLNDFWNKRKMFVGERKREGIKDIVFTDKIVYNDDFIIYELEENPAAWTNKVYARFYGIRSVKRVTQ